MDSVHTCAGLRPTTPPKASPAFGILRLPSLPRTSVFDPRHSSASQSIKSNRSGQGFPSAPIGALDQPDPIRYIALAAERPRTNFKGFLYEFGGISPLQTTPNLSQVTSHLLGGAVVVAPQLIKKARNHFSHLIARLDISIALIPILFVTVATSYSSKSNVRKY